MFDLEQKQHFVKLSIEEEMTIYHVAEIKTLFDSILDDPRELEINLHKVSQIDCAGIQLLMLAKKERDKKKLSLTLTQHSNAVLEAFEFLGLVSYFNDIVVLPKAKGEAHGS